MGKELNRGKVRIAVIAMALIMIITGAFSLCSQPAMAAEVPTVTVTSINANAGETVEVPIVISNNPGITTIDFHITYDSNVMKLVGKTDGGLLKGGLFSQNLTDIPYYCGWINSLQMENCIANGNIITLKFEIASNATDGIYPVSISERQVTGYAADLSDKRFNVVNGQITVGNPKQGTTGGASPNEGSIAGAGDNTGANDNNTPVAGGSNAGNNNSNEGSGSADNSTSVDSGSSTTAPTPTVASATEKKFKAMTVKLSGYSSQKRSGNRLYWSKSNSKIRVPKYQVWRATSKTGTYKKVFTTSKTYFTDKNVKKGKTYYYKVRGVRMFREKNRYTQWSNIKKVTY